MLRYMNLLDKLIIFGGCTVFFLMQSECPGTVSTLLIAIIISGLLSIIDDERLIVALTLGYTALAFFFPQLIFYLPLIAFDMLFGRYKAYNLLAVIPLVKFAQNVSGLLSSILIIFVVLAIWVSYQLGEIQNLQKKYFKLRDTTREMSLELEKHNQELIKNQDNELNMATLNERNRIAREIHDNVGHLLSSAILQSGALLTINQDDKVREHLETLQDTLTHAMNNIRDSVHNLYDESIDMNTQIEELLRNFTFCEINYEYGLYNKPGRKLKNAIVAIIKEALANIMKHSNASQAQIILREHPGFYQLIIRDNGQVKAYDPEEGMGLKNMATRIKSFNGNINISTEQGFSIFISVPKEGI